MWFQNGDRSSMLDVTRAVNTVEGFPSGGVRYYPRELPRVIPNQKVSCQQMTPEEQSAVVERSAARPHERIQTTGDVADAVGLLRIIDPIVAPGSVVKALIVNHCGRFYDAMPLKNWGIVFLPYQTVRDVELVLYEELH